MGCMEDLQHVDGGFVPKTNLGASGFQFFPCYHQILAETLYFYRRGGISHKNDVTKAYMNAHGYKMMSPWSILNTP